MLQQPKVRQRRETVDLQDCIIPSLWSPRPLAHCETANFPLQLLHLFPRHVIIGCIGGFGVFLLITALEISTGLTMGDMGLSEAFQTLFSEVRAALLFYMLLRGRTYTVVRVIVNDAPILPDMHRCLREH